MEYVVNLPFQFPSLFDRYTQHGSGQVTGYGKNTLGGSSPLFFQSIEFLFGVFPDQDINAGFFLLFQQCTNQVMTDKAGSAGNEVIHGCPPRPFCNGCSVCTILSE